LKVLISEHLEIQQHDSPVSVGIADAALAPGGAHTGVQSARHSTPTR